jgi:hypothetical protein
MSKVSGIPRREDKVITDFIIEIDEGVDKFGNYRSYHEAYAVILEEVDELWDELKKRDKNKGLIYGEAIQVAATAYRLAEEIYLEGLSE